MFEPRCTFADTSHLPVPTTAWITTMNDWQECECFIHTAVSNLLLINGVGKFFATCQNLLIHPHSHFICQAQWSRLNSVAHDSITNSQADRIISTVIACLRPGVRSHQLGCHTTPIPAPNDGNSLLLIPCRHRISPICAQKISPKPHSLTSYPKHLKPCNIPEGSHNPVKILSMYLECWREIARRSLKMGPRAQFYCFYRRDGESA